MPRPVLTREYTGTSHPRLWRLLSEAALENLGQLRYLLRKLRYLLWKLCHLLRKLRFLLRKIETFYAEDGYLPTPTLLSATPTQRSCYPRPYQICSTDVERGGTRPSDGGEGVCTVLRLPGRAAGQAPGTVLLSTSTNAGVGCYHLVLPYSELRLQRAKLLCLPVLVCGYGTASVGSSVGARMLHMRVPRCYGCKVLGRSTEAWVYLYQAQVQDKNKQRAEVAVYFKKFDEVVLPYRVPGTA
eukprot:1197926-Rhodomonas_salina.5